ncbi:hypothetical protein [Nocardioides euryhalodurans]|uniref:Uncharacterized protein n=1 Tax=Nocardioides euryhalodurans TaxID=2518370 RepID=A0A4P7GMR6_9ACTN|nr:hypothetical protein [Nocardioides euryhalodurans]QBR93446.1 hypothetical protein EXE57_15090 [Nocardioides euryhalodurans]
MDLRPAPLRSALVAAVLLAGLFAMHGLTHHGEHLPTAADHSAAAAPAPSAVGGHEDPAPGDGGAMALCLTVLVGATLVWLARGRPRLGLLPLPRLMGSRVVVSPPPVRAHGPPGRWSLSVCRC